MIKLFLLSLLLTLAAADKLETMPDADLDKLIRQEQYVIVLFTGAEEDAKSEAMEVELAALREDLVDSINAWVVKAVGSKLKERYSQEDGNLVVFFRSQNPVIYDGAANEEELLETLSAFKDQPCVKDLTDTNFEHLTQASTGATTGDWMVLFFKDECEQCDKLAATLETVACKHRGRINVARINRGTTGAVTGRRFEVAGTPELIFFRLGRMYRYTIGKYDIASLTSFITGWYKNVQGESIPLPKSPFDDLVQLCVDYIRDYPAMFALLAALPILLCLAFWYLTRSDDEKPKKKKKKAKAT